MIKTDGKKGRTGLRMATISKMLAETTGDDPKERGAKT